MKAQIEELTPQVLSGDVPTGYTPWLTPTAVHTARTGCGTVCRTPLLFGHIGRHRASERSP